jgi:hypothetical protein
LEPGGIDRNLSAIRFGSSWVSSTIDDPWPLGLGNVNKEVDNFDVIIHMNKHMIAESAGRDNLCQVSNLMKIPTISSISRN